jgi:hypothetical protein
MDVWVMPEIYFVKFQVETWIDFYAGGSYTVGDSGF